MIEFDRDAMKNFIKSRVKDTKKLNSFLVENKELIDNNAFDELFIINMDNFLYSANILAAILLYSGIDFLNYMDHIPEDCFLDLPVTKVIIPDNVEAIQGYAFRYCYMLKEVSIPQSIEYIGDGNFYQCGELETIFWQGDCEEFNEILPKDLIDNLNDNSLRDPEYEAMNTEIQCKDGSFIMWYIKNVLYK